jgi:hypothetical protein
MYLYDATIYEQFTGAYLGDIYMICKYLNNYQLPKVYRLVTIYL